MKTKIRVVAAFLGLAMLAYVEHQRRVDAVERLVVGHTYWIKAYALSSVVEKATLKSKSNGFLIFDDKDFYMEPDKHRRTLFIFQIICPVEDGPDFEAMR